MAKEIFCAFGVDVDAVGGWLGSYGGEDSPLDISRGMFSGEVGTPRLVQLFDRFGIKTTWFVPGHSCETFPDQIKKVVDGLAAWTNDGQAVEASVLAMATEVGITRTKAILEGLRSAALVEARLEWNSVTTEPPRAARGSKDSAKGSSEL